MSLQIVSYPHPTLRHKSKPIKRVDAELRTIVRSMFDLMYEARGVGLAANQVNLPIRLFVVNLAASPDEGEELVFINPVISKPKGSAEAEEGCLSLPGLYANVTRPKQIRMNAYNLSGEEISADVSGFLARVLQHEFDHLDGILFTDRLSETGKLRVQDSLASFESEFEDLRQRGEMADDQQIATELEEWERRYC